MERKSYLIPRWLLAVFIIALPLCIGVGFWIAKRQAQANVASILQIRQSNFSHATYPLINPLIGCQLMGVTPEVSEFKPLRDSFQSVIADKTNGGAVDSISVYFDTRDGRTLTINPDALYSPASLMKVPLMIAVFRAAEKDPTIFEKKIMYAKAMHNNDAEFYKPSQELQPGTSYTVGQLVEHMIGNSDNNALDLLLHNIDTNLILSVYDDLGVPVTSSTVTIGDSMTIKRYSTILRFLYNATYLGRDYSELAMELLTRPDFPQGMQAALPTSTVIAQKFGERTFTDSVTGNKVNELHDCGVIYYPDHPYMLCVMTRGKNFDVLAKSIRDITAASYDFMATEYPVKKQ